MSFIVVLMILNKNKGSYTLSIVPLQLAHHHHHLFFVQVSPQFDTAAESRFLIHRKHHRDQARRPTRRSTCKFPCLTFESPQSSSSETLLLSNGVQPQNSEKNAPRRPLVPLFSPQSCRELSVHVPQSLPHVFTPPDIQTPESSVREDPISPDQKENSFPGCILGPRTPSSPEPGPVLVQDTPEEKYGIKVTWRRRGTCLPTLKRRGSWIEASSL